MDNSASDDSVTGSNPNHSNASYGNGNHVPQTPKFAPDYHFTPQDMTMQQTYTTTNSARRPLANKNPNDLTSSSFSTSSASNPKRRQKKANTKATKKLNQTHY
jgi:hypothetical protein